MPFKARITQAILLLVLVAPAAWLGWQFRDMPHFSGYHDDSIYFLSAQSLAQGEGYRIPHLPGQPAQTKYPPLYPALLSLVWLADAGFPDNLVWVTAIQWSFLPAFLVLAWLCFRRWGFSRAMAWVLTGVLAFCPMTILFSLTPLTELPFAVVLLGVMLLVADNRDVSNRRALAAGLLAAVAFLIRTNGVFLLVSVPAVLLLRKKRRAAILFALPLAAALAAWQWWCITNASPAADDVILYYTSYLGFHIQTFDLAEAPARAWMNLSVLLSSMARLVLFSLDESLWFRQLSWLISITAFSGIWAMVRRGHRQFAAFAVPFLLILVIWTFPPEPRFVFPLLPLYLAGLTVKLTELAALVKTSWASRAVGNRAAAVVVGGCMAVFLAACTYCSWWGVFRLMPGYFTWHGEQQAEVRPAYRWIAENTPPDAVIAACNDTLLYLATGRRGYTVAILPRLFYAPDSSQVSEFVAGLPETWRARGIRHVLLTKSDFHLWGNLQEPARDALARLAGDTSRFSCLRKWPGAAVYRTVNSPVKVQGVERAGLD